MAIVQKIAPCLWFDHQAEDAVMNALLQMKKLDLAALRQAYGKT